MTAAIVVDQSPLGANVRSTVGAATGRASKFDEAQVVRDSLSIDDGAILAPGYKPGSWQFRAYAEAGKFPVDVPVGEFTAEQRHALLYGGPEKVQYSGFNTTYQGLIPRLEAPFLSKEKECLQKGAREFVDRAVTQVDCPACGGTRLAQHALESKINGKNIAELCAMEVADLAQ